jgi:WD40-like Beta Propeller Repeat
VVFTTKPMSPPSISIDPVTEITGTTATFSGMINPEAPEGNPAGFNVAWRFHCTPECPGIEGGTVASAEGEQKVEVEAKNLEPKTDYQVRLIAENAGGQIESGTETFKTSAVAPAISPMYAGSVTGNSAVLAAKVDPRNSPVEYQFEWGPDTGYGNLAPASLQTLAASNASQVVTAAISGLQPDAIYHFRVRATNSETSETSLGLDHAFKTLEPAVVAPGCSNESSRTGFSARLSNCRAYEMVSPLAKGADIRVGAPARAAEDGNSVGYMSQGSFGDPVSRGLVNQFRSARSSSGWSTRSINPPSDPYPTVAQGAPMGWELLSSDLEHGVGQSWGSQVAGHPETTNLWRYDAEDSSHHLLTIPTGPFAPDNPVEPTLQNAVGASEDFSHIVFYAGRPFTLDVPDTRGYLRYLYEWVNGELRLINYLPNDQGGSFVPNASLGYGNHIFPGYNSGEFAISADGNRIYWTDGGGNQRGSEVYLRQDDPSDGSPPETLHVSAREGGPSDDGTTSAFQLASADGSRAFITSSHKLTSDATASGKPNGVGGEDYCGNETCDLYRWDPEAEEGHRLTDLTTADPDGGGVLGTAGSSRDATSVYFVAAGNLAAGATDGEPNLYLWRQGEGVHFIATLNGSPVGSGGGPTDGNIWGHGSIRRLQNEYRDTRVTPDGRFLLLRSAARLTSYDNAGHHQIYLYDAEFDHLACVSCSSRVANAGGDAFFMRPWPSISPVWLSRNISSDGSRVFFESEEALVPRDSNGRIDVYEWTAATGPRLISSGQSLADSGFVDASANGDDVFITTGQRLVEGDTDTQIDLYDTRIGGGFPPPPPLPACEGDACQPPPVVPNDPTPASSNFVAPVNQPPTRKRCRKGRQLTRKGRCVSPRDRKTKKDNRSTNNKRKVDR